MAEPIQIEVQFTGAQEAARAADTVSSRLDNMSTRTESAARSAQDLAARQTAAATSAIAFGQRLAAASNAVQGLMSALGVEGQTAGLIGRVTQTSTAMAQLGASFGPQGALVGGILGAAIPAIQFMSQQLTEQEQRIHDLRDAADNLVTSYDDILARINQVSSEAARTSRLTMGLGSLNEQQAFLEQQEALYRQTGMRLDAATLSLSEARSGQREDAMASVRAAEEAQRTQLQALEQAREALALAQSDEAQRAASMMEELAGPAEEAAPARRGGGGRRRAEIPQAAAVDEGDAMAVVRDILQEQNDALREQEELMRGINELKDQAQEKDERLAARADALAEREKDRLEEHQNKLTEAADQARQRHEEQVEVYKSVMGVVVGGLNDALQSIISGQKTAGEAFEGLLASFLKYISEQAMLKAIFEYAEAIASFASYRIDQGAQHLAAGVAYTAVAVAAGAGSVALSAPSASTPSDQKPASPEAGTGAGARGGGDVVINWNSPVVTAGTRAELGRDMASMIRAGSQRFGTV